MFLGEFMFRQLTVLTDPGRSDALTMCMLSDHFGSNYHTHMVAQPTRNTPFVNPSQAVTMDASFALPGAGHAGNPNPAVESQQPVVGALPAGQVYALPHLSWQHRQRGQYYPALNSNLTYEGVAQLPPPLPAGAPGQLQQGLPLPVPPGMPGQGQPQVLGPAAPQYHLLTPLAHHEHVAVPSSVNGDSVAQGQNDIEAAASAVTPAMTWYGSQTAPVQQPAMDLTMLTASLQSMAVTMQHLMTENQRLNEQMLKVMKQENGPKAPDKSDATQDVKRPLIGSFDRVGRDVPEKDDEGQQELKDIDKKDVALPVKYKGEVTQWRHWYMKFTSFLNRRDQRWGKLLEEIRKKSQDPLGPDEEDEIFNNVGITSNTLREKFKFQLYEYLETYSEGLVHGMVAAGGTQGALEVFRGLCDDGFSMRDRHLRREYRKVTHPKQATFENLKKAIMDWETELGQYQAASGTEMSEKEKIICLEDLCPDLLQQHLDSKESLKTYGQYKTAINDYLSNRARWVSGKARLNWLGLPEEGAAEDPGPEENGEEWINEQLNVISGEINALVRNKFKGKGFGKRGTKGGGATPGKGPPPAGGGGQADVTMGGTQGDTSKKKCYECNEFGHIANDCPVRKARVAAGGPERLEKKGTGKGGKNQGWPTKTQWGGFYPGPSQAQWNQWFPQQPRGGVAALQDQNGQPQTVLQSLFTGPQQLSLKSITPKPKSSFATPNRFSALTAEGDDEKVKQSETKITASIEEFIRPAKRGLKKTRRPCRPTRCCEDGHAEDNNEIAEGNNTKDLKLPEQSDMPDPAEYKDLVRPARRTAQSKTRFATAFKPCGDKCSDGACQASEHRPLLATSVRHVQESGGIESPTDEPTLGETPKIEAQKVNLLFTGDQDKEYGKFIEAMTQEPNNLGHNQGIAESIQFFLELANAKAADFAQQPDRPAGQGKINMLNKVAHSGNLMPVTEKKEIDTKAGKFEVMSCIVDSGATVPVMHPTTGAAYPLMESEASRDGTVYALANDDTLPNLGEKKMAVLTAEGTLRGYGSQAADVSKPLQAVRSLVSSKHAVCFGLGDGTEHLIINKQTGEINKMRDDGINYLQDLLIIPPDQVDNVAAELQLLQQRGHEEGQSFGRPGP